MRSDLRLEVAPSRDGALLARRAPLLTDRAGSRSRRRSQPTQWLEHRGQRPEATISGSSFGCPPFASLGAACCQRDRPFELFLPVARAAWTACPSERERGRVRVLRSGVER